MSTMESTDTCGHGDKNLVTPSPFQNENYKQQPETIVMQVFVTPRDTVGLF
ncbi:MAG: hypothetical protein NVSMB58_13800 [Terriglobales bacterium]